MTLKLNDYTYSGAQNPYLLEPSKNEDGPQQQKK